jgi:hypothetical protein
MFRHLIVLLALGYTTTIAASVTATMAQLKKNILASTCTSPQTLSTCSVKFDTVTETEIAPSEKLWAVSYSVTGAQIKTQKDAQQISIALRRLGGGAAILEENKERVSAISYYREKSDKITNLTPEDFHKFALRPFSQVVTRYQPDFIESGSNLTYVLPETWKKEGLAPGTSNAVAVSGMLVNTKAIALEILSLDDKPVPTLSITECTPACRPEAITAGMDSRFQVNLTIKAGRNIKSDQPAFKILVKAVGTEAMIAQIAIPFKPRPNYFLFGITGFLVGGLIAVMMLFMRRKQKPAAAST